MSSQEEKSIVKIFCSKCSQKLDVSEFKSFSSFPCPVCENDLTVPKKLGEVYLLKKLSSHTTFESYLALKDDDNIVAKVRKNQPDLEPEIIEGMENISAFDPGFKILEKNVQNSGLKEESKSSEKIKNTTKDKKPTKGSKAKTKEASKSLAKKASEKTKKKLPKKVPKLSQKKASNPQMAVQKKAVRLNKRPKSNNSVFIILGVVAAVIAIAFIAMPTSPKQKNTEVSEAINEASDKNKADRKRQKELDEKQELISQQEEQRKALEKEAELARQEVEKRKQELVKKEKLALEASENERQKELNEFLALVNPPPEELKKFDALPAISAANLKVLVDKHCVECHNEKKNKGDLNLDVFTSSASLLRAYETIKHAYESVVVGDMPPDEDDISEQDLDHLKTY
ncbi:MAG: c-type cytochrome, partial [Lentisphaeraceae bacterium]|nr:c-type cytochrome [Lentisphaeraceae bacterium]